MALAAHEDKEHSASASDSEMNNNKRVILSTQRLMLRPAYRDDATSLHSCFSDPEVMRYWDTTPHTSIEQTSDWVDKMIAASSNGVTDFVMCRVSSPVEKQQVYSSAPSSPVIGKIGVWKTAKGQATSGEIGFILDRQYWRQGLVSEALSILLPFLFQQKGFEVITADVDPRNEASKAILLKFGFEVVGFRERTFQIAGEWADSVDLALTKEAFEKWLAGTKS